MQRLPSTEYIHESYERYSSKCSSSSRTARAKSVSECAPTSKNLDLFSFEESMASYDPSHDILHVNRVRKTAMRLAKRVQDGQPDMSINLFVVELAALFHDLFECV